MIIEKYPFDYSGKSKLAAHSKGTDWPVVYLISNASNLYIGETTSASARMDNHLKNKKKKAYGLTEIRVVFDDEFNKSVILDYEQRLIKCCAADNKFNLINGNLGQSQSHDYYDRNHYENQFPILWDELIKQGMADNNLSYIENQDIFKYSPYNALTSEQDQICADIINDICDSLEGKQKAEAVSLVNGCAGTGKTVLAISLINSIVNADHLDVSSLGSSVKSNPKVQALIRLKKWINSSRGHKLSIAIVFPMTGIRGTIRTVFKKSGNGLKAKMVVGPYDITRSKYDIIFVDEAHRLYQYRNVGASVGSYIDACNRLGLNPSTTNQLDWVLKQGTYNVLFYDEDQTVKGSDITKKQFNDSLFASKKRFSKYSLQTQMRCKGGTAFTDYIKDIMNCKATSFLKVNNYEFKIYSDVNIMVNQIRKYDLDPDIGLSKTVAGDAWNWVTKPSKTPPNDMVYYNNLVATKAYDIDINGNHYIWNLTTEDWISRLDSTYTIGCIHTTQGFDLNYVGVIFGEEIDYDPVTNTILVDSKKFYDTLVKRSVTPKEFKTFIINTYTTMMARGIKGCYVYACNKNLREYLEQFIEKA